MYTRDRTASYEMKAKLLCEVLYRHVNNDTSLGGIFTSKYCVFFMYRAPKEKQVEVTLMQNLRLLHSDVVRFGVHLVPVPLGKVGNEGYCECQEYCQQNQSQNDTCVGGV